MESNRHNIDDLFKERLGGYSEVPPPAVWEALEERLDNDKKKRPAFFLRWQWFTALLLCVLLGAAVVAVRNNALSPALALFNKGTNHAAIAHERSLAPSVSANTATAPDAVTSSANNATTQLAKSAPNTKNDHDVSAAPAAANQGTVNPTETNSQLSAAEANANSSLTSKLPSAPVAGASVPQSTNNVTSETRTTIAPNSEVATATTEPAEKVTTVRMVSLAPKQSTQHNIRVTQSEPVIHEYTVVEQDNDASSEDEDEVYASHPIASASPKATYAKMAHKRLAPSTLIAATPASVVTQPSVATSATPSANSQIQTRNASPVAGNKANAVQATAQTTVAATAGPSRATKVPATLQSQKLNAAPKSSVVAANNNSASVGAQSKAVPVVTNEPALSQLAASTGAAKANTPASSNHNTNAGSSHRWVHHSTRQIALATTQNKAAVPGTPSTSAKKEVAHKIKTEALATLPTINNERKAAAHIPRSTKTSTASKARTGVSPTAVATAKVTKGAATTQSARTTTTAGVTRSGMSPKATTVEMPKKANATMGNVKRENIAVAKQATNNQPSIAATPKKAKLTVGNVKRENIAVAKQLASNRPSVRQQRTEKIDVREKVAIAKQSEPQPMKKVGVSTRLAAAANLNSNTTATKATNTVANQPTDIAQLPLAGATVSSNATKVRVSATISVSTSTAVAAKNGQKHMTALQPSAAKTVGSVATSPLAHSTIAVPHSAKAAGNIAHATKQSKASKSVDAMSKTESEDDEQAPTPAVRQSKKAQPTAAKATKAKKHLLLPKTDLDEIAAINQYAAANNPMPLLKLLTGNTTVQKADSAAHKADTASVATSATDTSAQKTHKFLPGFEIGIKVGFESGFSAAAANKLVIAPFFERRINKRFSLLVQPALKYSNLQGHRLDGSQTYSQVTDSNSSCSQNLIFIAPTGDTMWGWHYDVSQTRRNVEKNYVSGGRYFEMELPILLKYRISARTSVYGGVNLAYSKYVPIREVSNWSAPYLVVDSSTTIPSFGRPADPIISAIIKPASNSLSTYSGPLYPPPSGGVLRMGYMLGFSYEFRKRWLLDAMVQQGIMKTNIVGGYNVNSALAAPYFRFTIGYRLR